MIMSSANCLILFCLLFIAVQVNSASIPCEDCNDRATYEQLANVVLRLYTGETLDEYTSVLIGDAADLLRDIDFGKRTVLYIHGWTESSDSASVGLIVNAYLERKDHNILVADYQEIAGQDYISSIRSAEGVGIAFAGVLDELVSSGLEPRSLHVVSHSLGSQIAGFIGRNVNFSLPRITALDPAGPGFNVLIPSLTSDDAEFVDVILTDGGLYGNLLVKGTVNFYPNGGIRVQPGCPIVTLPLSSEAFCSHHRSWRYYAESVRTENAFIGLQCDSLTSFLRGSCSSNEKVLMGYGVSTTARGNVYLQTNSESPYGRGEDDA